jgi:hypothetical protein
MPLRDGADAAAGPPDSSRAVVALPLVLDVFSSDDPRETIWSSLSSLFGLRIAANIMNECA